MDLFNFIDGQATHHPDFCSANYTRWERKVAQPMLENAGFTVHYWTDGERDSFGPLTRICHCEKDEQNYQLIYG